MAITLPTDFKLRNDLIETGYVETVAQAIEAFQNGGNGAIQIESGAIEGNYAQSNFLKEVASLVTRRINQGAGADGAATALAVTEGDQLAARIARKIGPVDVTLSALRTRNMGEDAISLAIGQQIAKATVADKINTAAASLVGALTAVSGAYYDNTAVTAKTLDYEALSQVLQLAGDGSTEIVAFMMHSKPFFDLMRTQLNPSTELYNSPSIGQIFSGNPATLGRPIIVTDSAPMVVASDYWCFALKAGAIMLKEDTMPTLLNQMVLGNENIAWRLQGESDYICRVQGYAYKTAAGVNPTLATLATTGSWDLDAGSAKQGGAFALKVD